MLRGVIVLGRMFILGRITTTDVAAGQAKAQMNPSVPGFHTVFADVLVRFFNFDLIQVRAFICHSSSPFTILSEVK